MLVLGVDAAFSNFGMCRAHIDGTSNLIIKPQELKLISTEGQDKKVVRKSSDDLRRARELLTGFHATTHGCVIAFAEVPHGSQSARASWSLGIAVGVLASCLVPMIQVSALEVKLASVGKKTASKEEMIQWATSLYPDLNWIRCRGRLTAANEHLADAIATIHAGIRTNEFKGLLALVEKADSDFHLLPQPRRRVKIK